jgi:hypothetical protein
MQQSVDLNAMSPTEQVYIPRKVPFSLTLAYLHRVSTVRNLIRCCS